MNNDKPLKPYDVNKILNTLNNLRVCGVLEEYEIQNMISELLQSNGISFVKEYKLGLRNRIDFLISGGIGIEVKKGKPNKVNVIHQLERYTKFNEITAIIFVIERSMDIPKEINNKPCISFGLNKLWGIAL